MSSLMPIYLTTPLSDSALFLTESASEAVTVNTSAPISVSSDIVLLYCSC